MHSKRDIILFALSVAVCIAAFSLMPTLLGVQMGGDWFGFFRPRALHIENLYDEGPTSYVPWTFVPLIPIALLPKALGYGVLLTCSVAVLTAYTGEWWRALLLVLCWPVLDGLQLGQIDALMVLALMLPLRWGVVVALMKPIVLLPWLVRSVQKKGLLALVEYATWVLAASLILWRGWPGMISGTDLVIQQMTAMWPYLIPIGLLLLAQDDEKWWLLAGVFLTPYISFYHLTPVLAYFYKRESWQVLVLVTVATWLPVIIGG